jgi:GntR family transcriptional regulator
MISKQTGTPLHVQLSDFLKLQIQNGSLSPNSQLPSERELCERFGISRITVRAALADLAKAGLTYSVSGKGTFVASPRINEELRPLSSFTADMQRRGQNAVSRILDARIVDSGEEQALRLQIPIGTPLFVILRLRLVQGDATPIALQRTWIPVSICPSLLDFDLETRSLYEILRSEFNLRLTKAQTVIAAALATGDEAELLEASPPFAVLISYQTTYSDDGILVEFTKSTFRSDRYTLQYNI